MARLIGMAGVALVGLALAGLLGAWDDAAMSVLVAAIKPTNTLYDGTRIWISVASAGLFLVWLWRYAAAHYHAPSSLPRLMAPGLFAASIAVTPLYWSVHHGWGWVPEAWFAEDGPFEYLTVLILLAVAVLALAGLYRGYARLDRAERILLAVFALALVVLAGEEASWGQRILNIETPENLKASNYQGELNVHNLFLGWNEVFRMVIACVLSAIVISMHHDAVPGLRGRLDILKPDDRFFWFPAILIPSHLYDEWFEQVVSFAILSYGVMIYRRLRDPVRLA